MSLDALLVFFLVGARLWIAFLGLLTPYSEASNSFLMAKVSGFLSQPAFQGPLITLLLAYAALDLLRERFPRRVFLGKVFLLLLLVVLVVILPTTLAMALRRTQGAHLYMHDGAIQTEEAAKLLVAGKNPYTASYRDTPMADWPFQEGEVTRNPALEHAIYLPFLFLFSVPFYLASQAALGWYDQRLVYLMLFLGSLWLALRLPRRREGKLSLAAFLALNPLMVPFLMEGRNDVFILFWLLLSTYLLGRGRLRSSALALGIACATKQTAWLFLPFYLAHLLRRRAPWQGTWERLRPALGPLLLAAAVLVLPFLLWSPHDFLQDTLRYQATLYTVRGWGLSHLLLRLGVIPSNQAPFPFWALQLAAGLPTLALLLVRQWQRYSLAQVWTHFALLLLVVGFTSRAFNDNYLGFILACLAVGFFLEEERDGHQA
ncbi:MAG: glycosyltransferase 87 family protein [Anaerolineae bacterium]